MREWDVKTTHVPCSRRPPGFNALTSAGVHRLTPNVDLLTSLADVTCEQEGFTPGRRSDVCESDQ